MTDTSLLTSAKGLMCEETVHVCRRLQVPVNSDWHEKTVVISTIPVQRNWRAKRLSTSPTWLKSVRRHSQRGDIRPAAASWTVQWHACWWWWSLAHLPCAGVQLKATVPSWLFPSHDVQEYLEHFLSILITGYVILVSVEYWTSCIVSVVCILLL